MEIWKWGALGAVVVAAATAMSIQTGFFNPFDSQMTRACEATLKKRLRSPSLYKRVEISLSQKTMSLETYMEMEAPSDQSRVDLYTRIYKRAVERGDEPTVFTQYISYDAPNAYGTPIRNVAECEYPSSDGSKSSAREHNVRVNGLTHMGWLVEQISQLRTGG